MNIDVDKRSNRKAESASGHELPSGRDIGYMVVRPRRKIRKGNIGQTETTMSERTTAGHAGSNAWGNGHKEVPLLNQEVHTLQGWEYVTKSVH